MIDRSVDRASGIPVVDLRGVSVRYDYEVVLEEVDLALHSGDFLGIIGPNGGGKTTLLRVLLGLVKPAAGEVRVLGLDPVAARPKMGYVPQALEFDRAFPIRVRDVVRMGRLGRGRLFRRFDREDEDAVDRALAGVDLLSLQRRPLAELSGGQRQRALIARALAVEPEVLLLDEPTASVDARVRTGIYELLAELNREMTILMVTHDMSAIASAVKSVACLNRRLHYHGGREISREMLEETYQCPVELVAHGIPHRVFPHHHEMGHD